MRGRKYALVPRCVLLCLLGCVLAAPASKTVQDDADEQLASVEQVPPPAPLITESGKQRYRMPGLYALGSKPFYLQQDPITGAIDFSKPIPESENHRYSSRITQPGSSDDVEYDDEVAVGDGDLIDRKDTLGSNTPNDIKPANRPELNQYLPNSQKQNKPSKERFPLISSSYANTKVQGMGITNRVTQNSPATSTGIPPTYYGTKDKANKEPILDLWPEKKTTTAAPIVDTFDYYDETAEEAYEQEPASPALKPTTDAQPDDYNQPGLFYTTELPSFEEEPATTNIPDKSKTNVFLKPYEYEEPFRPIYGTSENGEPSGKPISNENVAVRPRPPSIYELQPPKEDTSHLSHNNRYPLAPTTRAPVQDERPILSPPPITQPGFLHRPSSSLQQPLNYESSNSKDTFDKDHESFTVPPIKMDSQGWKQATYTSVPPQMSSTSRVQFPEDEDETHTTNAQFSNKPLQQTLPQGYEPRRPPPAYRPDPVRLRPVEGSPPIRRPPLSGPTFDRPINFDRPPRPPMRHQPIDQPNISDGILRLPHNGEGQIRPPQPPRRSDTRYPIQYTNGNQQQNKYPGYRPKENISHSNRPENQEVVLPQFRPNAKIPPGGAMSNIRVAPPASANRRHQQGPGYFDRLHPPPPPPVGRRVGPQVSTLQMIQHGSYPRLSARDDAPHPNPRPPVSQYEARPQSPQQQQQQQGSEDRPVFIVYANTGNMPSSDIHVGTHGVHKPVPPSHLTDEEPVLNKKPPHSNIPLKTDFPYALEKPSDDVKRVPTGIKKESDRDEGIQNIIPNLQDYMPSGIKTTTLAAPQKQAPVTGGITKPPEKSTSVFVLRPQSSKNEFTVSAVMHTGSQQGGTGTGSVMVVAPQHRHPETAQSSKDQSAPLHESFNFQAPFHPSANVAPSLGNGWSAVKGSTAGKTDTVRPGVVIDRADVADVHSSTAPSKKNTSFDIENFNPELIGGFKPIYSFSEDSTVDATSDKKHQKSTERQE